MDGTSPLTNRFAPLPARQTVVLVSGDGIGPEIAEATRGILRAAGATIDWIDADAGASVFVRGDMTGVPRETLDAIARHGVVLKGPLATPVGEGGKSANVTLRKAFETYANVRPVRTLPGVEGPLGQNSVDLVVVRENVEDLYAGIEHMQTPDVAQALKLVTRTGCDKILRAAFDLALAQGRREVTCVTKANILKLTEGMLKRRFEAIAPEYPGIKTSHRLVDACAHDLVVHPQRFDVIVTTNMNGDILSDLAAGLAGGLGLAPSANIGAGVAIFEPVHGTAPDIAGKGIANPTAMILAATMMLRQIGQANVADRIERALHVVLAEGGVRTADIAAGKEPVSTAGFADAVIAALQPREERPIDKARTMPVALPVRGVTREPADRRVVGVDVFIESGDTPASIGARLETIAAQTAFRLKMVSNRGTQVYPDRGFLVDCVQHWRCRFMLAAPGGTVGDAQIFDLLRRVAQEARWMHIEKLQVFDGQRGFTLAQGEE